METENIFPVYTINISIQPPTITTSISPSPSAVCRSNTKHVQIPYLRTSHRIDFLWLFLALWMDILALLTACAILARTISSCLDNMTGGMARILILGGLSNF